jgi:hypothetical protein
MLICQLDWGVYVPGSSLSGRRSINGPSPAFGAATSVLLAMAYLPVTAPYLSRALVRNNRGSILIVSVLGLNAGTEEM